MRSVLVLTGFFLIGAVAARQSVPAGEPAAPAAAAAPAPTFVRKPAVRKDGGKVVVDFELDREADVAVYVENAAGDVVRHLAAGVLGRNAPEPLKAGALAQSLVWDGRDDAGKEASGGPFKVRVAAGLSVAYDGTAFGSEATPNDLTNVIGLATGPDGRAYVLSERWNWAWWKQTSIHVFRRSGEYEKTIKPFPSSLAPERVAKLTPFATDDGRPMPVIYHVLYMNYYPYQDMPCQMAVTPDGNLHQVVNRNAYHKETEKWVASLALDGGVDYESYAGGQMPSATFAGAPHLAASSDGKSLYVTGFERLSAGGDSKERPNAPAVYRVGLPERKEAKLLFGDAKEAGAGENRLKDPRGLSADGKGTLYIADRGNDRVVAVDEKDGKFRFAFDVPAPTWVGAHQKTGAVYVASNGEVIKFAADKDGKTAEKARLKLPALPGREAASARWSFALDCSAEPAVLWVGLSRGGEALMRAEEQGDRFGDLRKAGYRPARTYWNLADGQDGRTVACKAGHYGLRILDERTGQTRDLRLEGDSGQTYRLGPNDQIYGMDHWKWGIRRWNKDGKPLPYAATKDLNDGGKGRTPSQASGTTAWERDFDVDRAGNVYVKQRGKIYHGRMTVDKYDPDGNKVGTLIWVLSDGALGPQLDAAGNLYIADIVKPVGEPFPKYFEGRLPKAWIEKDQNVEQQYRWMYGSVMKFGPEGGAIWFPKPKDANDSFVYAFEGEAKLPADQPRLKMETVFGDRCPMTPGEVQGAKWMHYGVSYVLDMVPSHNRRCHCTATELKVDPFGRVFYTDQGRFRVVVLDTGGNEILSFGQYGNQDACNSQSYVMDPAGKFLRPRREGDPAGLASPDAAPAIAFNWFTGLGVSDRWIYVADGSNRRVVRVKMNYGADETVKVE